MMDDVPSPVNDPGPDPVEAAAHDAAEAIADQAHEGVSAAATLAHEAAETSQATIDAAVDDTAKAFEAARDRLRQIPVADALPGHALLAQFKSGSDALNDKLGSGYQRASAGMAAFNVRAIEAWRTNAEASIAHWQNLAGVKSWSEMIALNAAHARRQIEMMTAQTRDLAELAGRVARDVGGTASKPSEPSA